MRPAHPDRLNETAQRLRASGLESCLPRHQARCMPTSRTTASRWAWCFACASCASAFCACANCSTACCRPNPWSPWRSAHGASGDGGAGAAQPAPCWPPTLAGGRQGGRAQRRDGEHYITRTSAEYRAMLRKAAGGG